MREGEKEDAEYRREGGFFIPMPPFPSPLTLTGDVSAASPPFAKEGSSTKERGSTDRVCCPARPERRIGTGADEYGVEFEVRKPVGREDSTPGALRDEENKEKRQKRGGKRRKKRHFYGSGCVWRPVVMAGWRKQADQLVQYFLSIKDRRFFGTLGGSRLGPLFFSGSGSLARVTPLCPLRS